MHLLNETQFGYEFKQEHKTKNETPPLVLDEEISRNHGHRVGLDPATALNLLRGTKSNGPILENIQILTRF